MKKGDVIPGSVQVVMDPGGLIHQVSTGHPLRKMKKMSNDILEAYLQGAKDSHNATVEALKETKDICGEQAFTFAEVINMVDMAGKAFLIAQKTIIDRSH